MAETSVGFVNWHSPKPRDVHSMHSKNTVKVARKEEMLYEKTDKSWSMEEWNREISNMIILYLSTK
jgi:hypothetical protein